MSSRLGTSDKARDGLLLGYRVVKAFPESPLSKKLILYLGTIVSYHHNLDGSRGKVIRADNVKIKSANKKRLGICLYRVLFDDGDIDDMDPEEAFKSARFYHEQRQYRIHNRMSGKDSKGVKKKILGVEGGVESDEDGKLSMAAGESELRRHANPDFDENRCQILLLERVAYWDAYKEYHKQEGIERPRWEDGSKFSFGWREAEPKTTERFANNVTHPQRGSENSAEELASLEVHPSLNPSTDDPPSLPASSGKMPSTSHQLSLGVLGGAGPSDVTGKHPVVPVDSPTEAKTRNTVVDNSDDCANNSEKSRSQKRNFSEAVLDEGRMGDYRTKASRVEQVETAPPCIVSTNRHNNQVNQEQCAENVVMTNETNPSSERAKNCQEKGHDGAPSSQARGAFDASTSRNSSRECRRQSSSTSKKVLTKTAKKSRGKGNEDLGLRRVSSRLKRIQEKKGQPSEPKEKGDVARKQRAPRAQSPSNRKGGRCSAHKVQLPDSSDGWIVPQSATSTQISHPEQTPAETTIGVFDPNISTTDKVLPTRILSLTCSDAAEHEGSRTETHELLLSVDTSSIPNAGRGLYVTYNGPNKRWIAPGYVDLGRYAPHQAADIKSHIVIEAKNFLFENYPSEWSFDGPPGSGQIQQRTLFEKSVDQDVIFDITSDATGLVHDMALATLLPFVNEVALTSHRKETKKGKRGKTSKDSQQRLDVQNVDAVHHDDGSVHYLLRAGTVLRAGERTELLVYYGPLYDDVRSRKQGAYGQTATETGNNKLVSVVGTDDNSAGSDNLSSLSAVSPQNGGRPTLMGGNDSSMKSIVTTVCERCLKCDRVSFKTPLSGVHYTSMYQSICTYSEQDLLDLLRFMLDSPPLPSLARHRMWWLASQFPPYASEALYHKDDGIIPRRVLDLLESALELFPRDRDSPYHSQDREISKAQQHLGAFIRKQREGGGMCSGLVEKIIAPPVAAALGRRVKNPGERNCRYRECDVRYQVSFLQYDEEGIFTQDEVEEHYYHKRVLI